MLAESDGDQWPNEEAIFLMQLLDDLLNSICMIRSLFRLGLSVWLESVYVITC